jgi:DNA-binding XRE family transcriptional regulator
MPGLTGTSGIKWGAALRESRSIEDAHRALGAELAAYRRAAGQEGLATLVGFSRSTIANVETGRPNVPRDFWKNAHAVCRADGALLEASVSLEVAVRREREVAARPTRLGAFPPPVVRAPLVSSASSRQRSVPPARPAQCHVRHDLLRQPRELGD